MWQKPSEACPLDSEPQPQCDIQHWQMSPARRSDSILFLSLQLLVSLSGSSLVTLNGEIPCLLMHTTGKLSLSDPGPGVWFALDSVTQRVSASLEKGSTEIDKLVREVHLKKIVSFRARQHAGAGRKTPAEEWDAFYCWPWQGSGWPAAFGKVSLRLSCMLLSSYHELGGEKERKGSWGEKKTQQNFKQPSQGGL